MTTLAGTSGAPAHGGQTRRISRDELVKLGQAGRPWAFLPLGLQAIAKSPEDAGLRLLAAANFARLGLRGLGLEQLEAVPEAQRAEATVRALASTLEAMPDDVLTSARRTTICRGNLEALAARGVDLTGHLDAWRERAGEIEHRATGDGNVVRLQRGDDGAIAQWVRLQDEAGESKGAKFSHRPGAGVSDPGCPPPFVLEGMDPPWLFRRLIEATPPAPDGFQPRIYVVQEDPLELLDGLSMVDLRRELSSERVCLIVGPEAGAKLEDELKSRSATAIKGAALGLPTVRTRATPGVGEAIQRAVAAQAQEHERLRGEVAALYAGRDAAWWAGRWKAALSGEGRPLRVLVPTCRFSTYVRHAASDIVEGLRASGCEARLLMEPDDHSRLASVAYLRELRELEPDLVLLINYTRSSFSNVMPEGVPYVCWVQDAMPHLFNDESGGAQGPLDFLAGHLHSDLFKRHGYANERALDLPVPASETKFHDGPVDAELLREHECEIACVTHHSEPPEALRDRMLAESGGDALHRRLIGAVYERMVHICDTAHAEAATTRIREAVIEILQAEGLPTDGPATQQLIRQAAAPLADRIFRHQVFHWALNIAERRGWRMHLYGRGWESHPRFAPCARGEREHGEPLRAAYQAAAVNLHASVHSLWHQRVLECAMSGGVPLCRRKFENLQAMQRATAFLIHEHCAPEYGKLKSRDHRLRTIDSVDALMMAAQRQRLGERAPIEQIYNERWALPEVKRPDVASAMLLGDLCETTFASEEELERLVEKAVEMPAWRRSVSGGISNRARRRFTYQASVKRILGFVAEGLERSAGG
ncbi:MAG: hypothetical protein EA376_09480 [Phycisphaeraceae bacterium]|nr:MAG: hypothetical protein EA376_09480 [Phycisphaeraceae bacterium]